MSFKSLEQILASVQEQSRWQEQPFQVVLKYWSEVVGATVASHTCPQSIQKQVLWVATSSAVWAQELSFGRQRLLEKLNPHLPSPLLDIRFSSARWQHPNSNGANNQATTDLGSNHPSCVVNVLNSNSSEKYNSHNPSDVFRDWARVMQARSHHLPLCPQCHCPTPHGELQRWAICSICAAKQW